MLRGLLPGAHWGGRLVNDAHLSALALEHGGTVYSQDTDFAAFPDVRWVNPSPSGRHQCDAHHIHKGVHPE